MAFRGKWCALFVCALGFQGICAQENVATETTQNVDSLYNVVNELNSQLDEVKINEKNEAVWKKRAKYFNFGYITNQELTLKDDVAGDFKWESQFGVDINWGRTYYIPKKPLFGMLKFGIDWSWMDISYVKYKDYEEELTGGTGLPAPGTGGSYYDYEEDELALGIHQVEYGMRIGPSITVNPVDHLKVGTYFHFMPSYSLILIDDEFNHGYVSHFVFGGQVAYKAISLGVEGRWGKATYKNLAFDDEGDDDDFYYGDFGEDDYSSVGEMLDEAISKKKMKFRTKSVRIYLSFRF